MNNLLCTIVQIYLVICVVRVVISWLDMSGSSILDSIAQISYVLTEPVFSSVRRFLPQMGDLPIDLSPLVVFLALGILQQVVCGLGI